jgi:mannose-6-phosphate isomerase-like protein (cupin superfamily)
MIQKLKFSDKDKEKISSLVIDPATQEDDSFDYSRVVIKKPWGYEYLLFQNDYTAVWLLSIAYGTKTSLHCHPNKKTGLVLLAGNARVTSLNTAHEISSGQGFLIDKGAFHSTEALSPEGIIVMEVETPVNKKDLVRFSDAYGRSGKGYENKNHHAPLDDTMHHFHKEEERYHQSKKFGDCTLMVARCTDKEGLQNLLSQTDADIVSILSGSFYNAEKQYVGEVGDTMNAHELRIQDDLLVPEEVELLLIKK